ncbi:hypothetical protein CL630_02805 [bacterium]|nr:hypothetical protein [bacterium]|tara:strand:- start:4207 stop:4545 length:339 start_codon:yes stop_codon:yes gene_type:complete
MNFFKKITSIFRERFLYFINATRVEFEITPYRDWLMLIIAMVIAGIILVGAAVYLFLLINSSEIAGIKEAETRLFETVNEEKLDEVLQIFKEREDVSETLLHIPPRVVDPSR